MLGHLLQEGRGRGRDEVGALGVGVVPGIRSAMPGMQVAPPRREHAARRGGHSRKVLRTYVRISGRLNPWFRRRRRLSKCVMPCGGYPELRSLLALLGETAPSPESISAVESAGRLMDAARIRVAAPLARDPLAAEHLGYASAIAAVASLAQVSERTARVRLALAGTSRPTCRSRVRRFLPCACTWRRRSTAVR